jgi:hypothetical protein
MFSFLIKLIGNLVLPKSNKKQSDNMLPPINASQCSKSTFNSEYNNNKDNSNSKSNSINFSLLK